MGDNRTVLQLKRDRVTELQTRMEVTIEILNGLTSRLQADAEEWIKMREHVHSLEAKEKPESESMKRERLFHEAVDAE